MKTKAVVVGGLVAVGAISAVLFFTAKPARPPTRPPIGFTFVPTAFDSLGDEHLDAPDGGPLRCGF